MSTALDAGVPRSNLLRGCFFCFVFFSYFYYAQKEQAALFQLTVNSEVFARFIFAKLSHAKFHENKIIAKWRNHYVVYLP